MCGGNALWGVSDVSGMKRTNPYQTTLGVLALLALAVGLMCVLAATTSDPSSTVDTTSDASSSGTLITVMVLMFSTSGLFGGLWLTVGALLWKGDTAAAPSADAAAARGQTP